MQGPRALEVLQSQLFVLKVLSIAMASRWKKRNEEPETGGEKHTNGPPSIVSDADSATASSQRMPRGRQPSSEQLNSLSPWIEPAPLEESCARYILSVMVISAALLHFAMSGNDT